MSTQVACPEAPAHLNQVQRDLFRAFLNVHWLRPEAALMKYYDAQALYQFEIRQPSLEVTCGDGTTSFVTAGGRFGLDFDVYQSVGYVERYFESRRQETYDPPDVYDYYQPLSISVVRRPDWAYTTGIDILPNAIEKARALDFYQELIAHDCNQPLPLESERFETVWTTSPYFIADVDRFFAEVHRVLRPGGVFLARVPSPKMLEMLPYNWSIQYGWDWVLPIDRGLYEAATRVPSGRAWWEGAFERAGLTIERIVPILPSWVYKLYVIGFRPMFPAFMEMYRRLDPENRRAVKQTWMDNVAVLAEPFCDPSWMGETEDDSVFFVYQARKK